MEKLVDDTVLCWIGPKRTDRVVLYLPGTSFSSFLPGQMKMSIVDPPISLFFLTGGGYVTPVTPFQLSYWHHIQLELTESANCQVGFAVLTYCMYQRSYHPQHSSLNLNTNSPYSDRSLSKAD